VRPEELENEAAHNRHIAARARRLAGSLSPGSERQGLERYAKELEHHAAELEAQARALRLISPSAPVFTWRQQQGKQRHAAKEDEVARRKRRH
jgi:hypothetical protein